MIVTLVRVKLPIDVDLIYVSTNYIGDFSDLETFVFHETNPQIFRSF